MERKKFEDAWERLEILLNGNIQVEAIDPAWTYSEMCGFYIEITIQQNDES